MGLLVPRPEPNAGSENHVAFLALERVSKHYGPMAAVDDVALTIQKGEFVSLLGPSGCGKTTTLQMIAGFVEPTAGAITLEGRDLTGGEAGQARPRHRVPELRAVPAHDGGRERRLRPRDAGRRRGRAQQARGETLALVRPRLLRRPLSRASCPAASSSAWRSPARWSSGRRSCCSTSRSPTSTPSCARRCRSSCARSSARSAPRPSW